MAKAQFFFSKMSTKRNNKMFLKQIISKKFNFNSLIAKFNFCHHHLKVFHVKFYFRSRDKFLLFLKILFQSLTQELLGNFYCFLHESFLNLNQAVTSSANLFRFSWISLTLSPLGYLKTRIRWSNWPPPLNPMFYVQIWQMIHH